MYDWRKRVERKKKNLSKGQTTGKSKGGSCQADTLDRYMCRSSRSYKDPRYVSWAEKMRKVAMNLERKK